MRERPRLCQVILPLCLVLSAASGPAGEPAAQGKPGEQLVVAPAARPPLKEGLPWPEPDAREVERMWAELKAQLPAAQFRFLRVGPWILASDLEQAALEQFAGSIIQVYAAGIQRQLFTRNARSAPIKVYLFKNAASYEAWNQKLFGEKPHTPFGYFSRHHQALVMNIATGGGTMIHEMVHALSEADWPETPSWLFEGLGSLFEASSRDMKGRITGVTNWRLRGLLEDLNAGSAPSLEVLLQTTTDEFYGARSGSNYAVARYLMQYLQSLGKLEAFYQRCRDGRDPSAIVTLRAAFGGKLSLLEIERGFHEWVKALRP